VTLVVAATGFLRDGLAVAKVDQAGETVIRVHRGGLLRGRIVANSETMRGLVVRGRDHTDTIGFRRFEIRPDTEGRFEVTIHPGTIQLEVLHGDTVRACGAVVVRESAVSDLVLEVK
jgi:hypothetical protein